MDTVEHQDVWIMHLLIQISVLSLLCHYIVAETRVLGIRILPFPSSPDSVPTLDRQLIIRCDVTAYPPVDAQNNHWFFENEKKELETGQKYTIYKEPSHGVVNELKNLLTIHGVTSRQLGKYTCYASNSAGMAGNATVKLSADDSSTIQIQNDDYIRIQSMDRNDQIENSQIENLQNLEKTIAVTTCAGENDVILQSTSGSGAKVPLLKMLVLSVIAVVHARRHTVR